ncbi:MAG: potassium transporter [Balneola sp.]|jgi:trk system potassium uptake protein TrkH|nr:potassium transporter [Balneola sp.]MBE79842.1 potassium transporter [Balneola sp.]|tara:strand:- start:474 stop:1988 length:1515 start_codon:yes stop_codon:yes gene_type:complete
MSIAGATHLNRAKIDFLVVLGVLGAFIFFMGFALLLPAGIDLIYGEDTWHSFLFSAAIAFVVGGALWYSFRPKEELRIREGFLVVSLTWLSLSLVGALPFVISGILPSFTDAVFETMSGLSTTGSTILGGTTSDGFANPQIEDIPKSFLFWRSLAHWLGGMGIIVLSLAILPLLGIGGMQLFQAESPGPTADKLTPRVQETAKLLWGIYVAFTFAEFILLWLHPAMDWFEAINHAFATMATGGFSTKNASIQAFNSAYIDWVIIIFMYLAGVNFAMHFRLIQGDRKAFFANREIRFYTLVIFIGIFIISGSLWVIDNYNILDALRYGAFQVLAIVTTTGFGTDNYEIWNTVGAFFLFLLFFTGGCAGSTGGGIKMIRWMILIRNTGREIKQIIHPKAILPVRIGDQAINQNIQRTVLSFFILYIFIFALGAFCISLFGYDIMSSIGASIAAIGNIGPGWGDFGPTDSFAGLPYLGKWILIMLMMVGRLEIFTVLIIFSPAFWKQ